MSIRTRSGRAVFGPDARFVYDMAASSKPSGRARNFAAGVAANTGRRSSSAMICKMIIIFCPRRHAKKAETGFTMLFSRPAPNGPMSFIWPPPCTAIRLRWNYSARRAGVRISLRRSKSSQKICRFGHNGKQSIPT